MHSVSFGGEEQERLEVTVTGYDRGTSADYDWLSVNVSIRAGYFEGQFPAAFLASELAAFYDQGVALYESLKGSAEFKTLEGQLGLILTPDNLGHIQLKGEARDAAGTGNMLRFSFWFDQTQLRTSLGELAALLSNYGCAPNNSFKPKPLRGSA